VSDYAACRPEDDETLDAFRARVLDLQPFAGPISMGRWVVSQARPGDRVVYHVGDLALDCGMCIHPESEVEAIARQARAKASDLATAGLALLTQIRLREGLYLYCLTKR